MFKIMNDIAVTTCVMNNLKHTSKYITKCYYFIFSFITLDSSTIYIKTVKVHRCNISAIVNAFYMINSTIFNEEFLYNRYKEPIGIS